jgi:hypothetical protein
MGWLIWTGAAVSGLGLCGLLWTIVVVARARRRTRDDAAMRAVVQRMIPVNMAALMLSVLGLMAVIVGISLG